MRNIDSIEIGEKAELVHLISSEDVHKFVELTGDDNKLHVDKEYAKSTSYRKPVVHGMLGASFISTIIGTKLPGDGALWFSQSLDFILPARIGDTITVVAEVLKKDLRNNTIELSTKIYNQNKQIITSGFSKVKLIKQTKPKKIIDISVNEQKVALVIGATGGIGKATCLKLAKDDFDIIIHYNSNLEQAEDIKSQVMKIGKNAMIVKANIILKSDVCEMFSRIKRKFNNITALVNCSTSRFTNIKFSELEYRDMMSQININLEGNFNLIKSILPIMKSQNYGKIINITTQYIESPKPQLTHYISAKSALHGFSKSLAIELAPFGIRVNLVSPGMTNTDLIADLPEKTKLLSAVQTPLKKIAEPNDIASAISFLASSNSDYLTGETIRVNGGQIML